MEKQKAVVIGSGVAGLTAAAYLAQNEFNVTVVEQFPVIGGVTATLHQDGFSWDLGPMLLEGIGSEEPAGEILAELGISNKLTLIRDERGVEFPDFSLWKPDSYKGRYWRKERLKELFPGDRHGLDRYYSFYSSVVNLQAMGRKIEKKKGLSSQLIRLMMIVNLLPVKKLMQYTAAELMDEFFKDDRLKAVFTTLLADFVTPPSKFPAPGIPAINIESPFDKNMPLRGQPSYHYVRGGMEKLVQALSSVIYENNCEILTGNCVEKIIVDEDKVSGVRLKSGIILPADLVLASGGVRETMFNLVGMEKLPEDFIQQVESVPLMESVHMIHLGIDFDPTPFQRKALCYYYNTYDVEGAIQDCREGRYEGGEHGFLIYIPSMHSPEMAPPGKHAVTIYTIAPNILQKGDWQERGSKLTEVLLERAEEKIPGLRKGEVTRIVLTPQDFRTRCHLEHDAFGGRAPFIGRKGGPHKTPIQGLWFIGRQSEKLGG
ncbi:MAG: NAD(P)/FAD-dependent oxidoreductase, partial [Bacteroidales bacterium]|nr:NAD(P)/FAD-dependent oxidoreductase [Bacteroidales bacterium]